MYPFLTDFFSPTKWSDCSIRALYQLQWSGRDSCLFGPTCGNGVVETGETCDCGLPGECTDPCCNATTCEVAHGMECATGACCTHDCLFVAYGTECRVQSGDCDVAEHCLGDSGECPEDHRAANGIPCSSDAGYCIEGTCPTHEKQCQAAFGT